MRCGTRFHTHQARRQGLEERDHLVAPQLLLDDHLLVCVDAMNLEDILGKIQTNRLTCMWTAPSCDSSMTITLWHFDAASGRRPLHQKPTCTECHANSLPIARRSQVCQAAHW